MAISAGVLTAASLLDVKTEMKKIFSLNQIDAHLRRGTPVFESLANGQTFEVKGEASTIVDGRTCNSLIAYWLGTDTITIQDDDDLADDATDCVLAGAELGADSKTYVPNTKFHVTGSVVDTECMDKTDKTVKTAKLIADLMAKMDQELELRMHAFLLANRDTLVTADIAGFGQLQETGEVWDIDGTDWDNTVIAKFKILADKKQMFDPKLISGANLYEQGLLAKYKDGDATDYATLLRDNGPIPIVNNLLDFDAAISAFFTSTFIVDNANIAYFNTHNWKNSAPMDTGDQNNTKIWSMQSNRLTWKNGNSTVPVMYDVKMQRQCVGENEWADVYQIKHNGGLITGPNGSVARNQIIHVGKDWADS